MSSLNWDGKFLECDLEDIFFLAERITGCRCVKKYVEEDFENKSRYIIQYALVMLPHGKCETSTNDPFHKYDHIRSIENTYKGNSIV